MTTHLIRYMIGCVSEELPRDWRSSRVKCKVDWLADGEEKKKEVGVDRCKDRERERGVEGERKRESCKKGDLRERLRAFEKA